MGLSASYFSWRDRIKDFRDVCNGLLLSMMLQFYNSTIYFRVGSSSFHSLSLHSAPPKNITSCFEIAGGNIT